MINRFICKIIKIVFPWYKMQVVSGESLPSALPHPEAVYLGHDVHTVVTPRPPLVQTSVYQPPKRLAEYTLSHVDEDHGDHVVSRSRQRIVHEVPPPQVNYTYLPQSAIVQKVPVNRYYSVPVNHVVNENHVDHVEKHYVENVMTHVPEEVETHEIVHVPVTKTVMEPRTVTKKHTVMREQVVPTMRTETVPVVHSEQKVVTDHHTVSVPVTTATM
jgi:hypothetical protein